MADNIRRISLPITTAANGAATAFAAEKEGTGLTGRVRSIQYVKDGSTPYSNGVSVTVTGEKTGRSIWAGTNVNASVTVYPVAACVLTNGAASTLTEMQVPVINERIQFVLANGGNTLNGQFYVDLD